MSLGVLWEMKASDRQRPIPLHSAINWGWWFAHPLPSQPSSFLCFHTQSGIPSCLGSCATPWLVLISDHKNGSSETSPALPLVPHWTCGLCGRFCFKRGAPPRKWPPSGWSGITDHHRLVSSVAFSLLGICCQQRRTYWRD